MNNIRLLLASSVLVFAYVGVAQAAGDEVLQGMEARLSLLRLRFTDRHPDVVALLQQIEAHKSVTSDPRPDPGAELEGARARLAELRQTYTDRHPEVQAQIKLVEELELELQRENGQ
jgi:hypothetical protein